MLSVLVSKLKIKTLGEKRGDKREDGGGAGGHGSASLSTGAPGKHLQMHKISQNTSCEWTGVPAHWKGIDRFLSHTFSKMKEGREKEESEQDWTSIQGLGN